ncbi:hypothetical protein CASFOL_001961 [Castilleja foliolosa]|uniref:Sororin C-terminal region domain-containing protein n=1 Tax=Castilleja foliolosa TaxID=1961234 RepID=A0ABD3ED49_9LAMI
MKGHRMRKPLSDITDSYNLIPTSTLSKLVTNSANPSLSLKPPSSILKSSSVSSNHKLCSESSNRSDTSVGSSNFSGGLCSSTVRFRTPPFEVSSTARPGGRGSKNAAYNRNITEKSQKEEENNVMVAIPSSIERRKNQGKAIAEPFSSLPPEKFKENQYEIRSPGCLLEREKQNSKAYRNIISGLVEIGKEANKGTVNSCNRSYGKTEKGKGIVDPSVEKTKEKGKAIIQLSDVVEVAKSKGSSAAEMVDARLLRRKGEKRKIDAGAFSCPPMTKSKNLQIDLDEAGDIKSSKSWTNPHMKLKKKRSRIEDISELPQEFIEQQKAYYKEVDDFDLPEEEISQDELD